MLQVKGLADKDQKDVRELCILKVLEKRVKGISLTAISRKMEMKESDVSPILTTLIQKGIIQITYQEKKEFRKKPKKTRLYQVNPVFLEYVKYFRLYSSMLPFMERSAVQRIQKARTRQQTTEVGLRQATNAMIYLKSRGVISFREIKPSESMPPKNPAFLLFRPTKALKQLDATAKSQIISISYSKKSVKAYPFRRDRKLAGYYVRTPWKTFFSIDLRFVWFLHGLEKHFFSNQPVVNLNLFTNKVCSVCGVKYPVEVIIVACFLAKKAHKPLNVDITFETAVSEEPVEQIRIPSYAQRMFSILDISKDSPYYLDEEKEKERIKRELSAQRDPW